VYNQKINNERMIIPPYLQAGDTIALTATARSITREQILPAVQLIEAAGFRVLIEEDLFRVHHQFGGNDHERAEFFNAMLRRQEVKALWNVRGGYGTGRMVDDIDFEYLRLHPKWLIGFSDYTVIHGHVNRQIGMATLHATMPIFLWNKTGEEQQQVENAVKSMISVLKGDALEIDLSNCKSYNVREFEAPVVGGNLSVLLSMMGTASEPDLNGKILFIEDLDEYYYHIDRMMQTLRRSGKLANLKALLVGSFIQMHDHTVPFGLDVEAIIKDHCLAYNYPVIFDVNAGHHLENMAIPFGVPAKFQNGILTFATS
jgi:muramoyltetrapeptide carboxypeptidase